MNKKFFSAVAIAAMLLQSIAPLAMAEGDEVSVVFQSAIPAGTTLTLKITSEDTEFSYQWMSADSEDGVYESLKSDTNSTYVVTPRDKNQYIKAQITNLQTGAVTLSDNAAYIKTLGPVSRTNFSPDAINATMLTPAADVFAVGGQKFILLEETNDENSHYYILAERVYGARAFDPNGYAKFDPSVEGNIGKFLNHEFLTQGGGGLVLPQEIVSRINFDHLWWTEGGMAGGDCPSDYSFTAGLSLLSMSEAVKYHGKYGWQPLGSATVTPWWGRTQRGSGGDADNILAMMNTSDASGKGNMWNRPCTANYYIRPTFYLDEDFFKDIKCDLSGTGDHIKTMIAEKYTLEEMKELYNTEELLALGYEIKSAAITASQTPVKAGTVLTAQMKDKNAVRYEYQWYLSDGEEELGKKVLTNNSDTYTIAANDMDKWIGVTVTAVYADGSKGEPVLAINKIHVQALDAMARTDYPSDQRRAYKNNPKEYLFTAGGEQMILLDAFEDESAALYVMTADTKGTRPFDSDKTQKFDVEDKNNIGYWLNTDFLTQSVTISQDVQKYIDFDHLWWTEKGAASGAAPADYAFTAGVALLSRSEYSKYWGRFGWDNNDSIKTAWWLRTGRNTGASDVFCGTGIQDGNYANESANGYGNTWNKSADASYFVRPTFYLNRDFLLNAKVSGIGEKVAEAMRHLYSVEELLSANAGYTENDLVKLGIIQRPKADHVLIKGLAAVNAELTGSYLYNADKAEGNTRLGFEMSDTREGGYKNLANTATVKLPASAIGKYVRFYVTPVNTSGESGETVYSEPIKVFMTAKVAATDVRLTDSKGSSVTGLSETTKLNAAFTLTNYTTQTQKACAMLFVYDANHNMLDNRAVMVEVSVGGRVNCDTLSLPLPQYAPGNYAKLIIWDGMTTMSPAQNFAVTIQ